MPEGPLEGFPNISVIRGGMWDGMCYNCFYNLAKKALKNTARIDVLKIGGREGVLEDFDGIQYAVMSDLFVKLPEIAEKSSQIVMTTSLNTRTLEDSIGRESSNAWNMWGTQRFLADFAAFSTDPVAGPLKLQPLQFSYLLSQAQLDPSIGSYRQSFMKLTNPHELAAAHKEFSSWAASPPPHELRGTPPAYCHSPHGRSPAPGSEADLRMQEWIKGEMNTRCHPNRLHVPCDRYRGYDAILPCPQELMDNLAEDYAATKGWCNFSHPAAAIPTLERVDPGASAAFQQPALSRSFGAAGSTVGGGAATVDRIQPKDRSVRLAFFFTVYADAAFQRRLFERLYSPTHYFLFHLDGSVGGVSNEFEKKLRSLASKHSNVFLAKDVPIVYGASTATILLTKAMAWFNKYATGWDYFVPLTGSDYPLVPLSRIEQIFAFQNPPMPFVMGWTPGN
jgi:hypothetical protein